MASLAFRWKQERPRQQCLAQAVIDKENPPPDRSHRYCCPGPKIISLPASHRLRVGSLFRVRAGRPQAGDEAKTSQLPGSKPMQALLKIAERRM